MKIWNNKFLLFIFILTTIKIWKIIIYALFALNLYSLFTILFLRKKKNTLNKNKWTSGLIIKNIYMIKRKKKIDMIKHYLISYIFIFIFGFSLKILTLADNYLEDFYTELIIADKFNFIKFNINYMNKRILLKPSSNIFIKFKKSSYYYIYSPALIINGMFVTEYGPTLIENDLILINLNFRNLINNTQKIKKIFLLKKKIQLKSKPNFYAHTPNFEEEVILLKFYSPQSRNYWKYSKVDWCNIINPTNYHHLFEKYKIKGILITNHTNVIKIKSNSRDAFLALKLIQEKINFLENEEIKITHIKSPNWEIPFDWENDDLDKIKIFKEIINKNEIEIHTNSNDTASYITYPIINNIQIAPSKPE